MRPRRMAFALLCLGLLAGACSGDDVAPTSPDSTIVTASDHREESVFGATFEYPGDPDTGVATSIRELTPDEFSARYQATMRRDIPLAFALRACRHHGGGRATYDIQWRPADDVELPVTVALFVGPASGSSYSIAFGLGLFEVELAQPGTFRIEQRVDPDMFLRDPGDELSATTSARDDGGECQLSVASEFYVDDQTEGSITMEHAADLLRVDAPEGTLQWLAGSGHAVATRVERLFLDAPEEFDAFPDRVWIAPDLELELLSISEQFGCWRVRSAWLDGDVSVVQSRGCRDDAERTFMDRTIVGILDPAWSVTVEGPPDQVDLFIAGSRAVPVAGVEPLPEGEVPFDSLAAFEERLTLEGGIEYARFDWNGGVIVVHASEPLDDRLSEIEFTALLGEHEIAGGGGTPIQTRICVASYAGGDDERGYAFVYFDDPGIARVEAQRIDDTWESIELVDAGPFFVGLLADDLAADQHRNYNAPTIRGFDAAGAEIDCVRSN